MIVESTQQVWRTVSGRDLVTIADGSAKVHPLTVDEAELRALAAACVAAAEVLAVAESLAKA